MRLLKVLTIVLLFITVDLYSQAPPPPTEAGTEEVVEGHPGGDTGPGSPATGTSVPLDSGLVFALLAGGGLFAGFMRKSTKKKD